MLNLLQCLPLLGGEIKTGSISQGSCKDLDGSKHGKYLDPGPGYALNECQVVLLLVLLLLFPKCRENFR